MDRIITGKQHNSKMCFVCGLKNVAGLQASFYEMEDGCLVSLFTPREEHQSYPGRLHGGISSTILDETIGRAIMINSGSEVWGVTLELTVEYKKPVPLGVELKVIGRITGESSRLFSGSGEILLPDGEIAVLARGRYMKVPLDKISDFDAAAFEWAVVAGDNDPQSFSF